MQSLKERVKAKAESLQQVVENAKINGLVSTLQSKFPFFNQFDDRDPDPPFSQFSNPPPPWGDA